MEYKMFATNFETKIDPIFPLPKFTDLNDLCSTSTGGKIMFATDDFFATAENLLEESNPEFHPTLYTEFGKLMDGWETRRKRKPGHDWCIIKLATNSVIYGVDVDTAFFIGNYTPVYSIQAACLTEEEESLIPKRRNELGSACTHKELIEVSRLCSDKWQEIIPKTKLRAGTEATRHHYQKVVSDETYTHLRLNMYPDGGIARLRVFGFAKPKLSTISFTDNTLDLLNMRNGGVCQGYSNAHFGHPKNMIKPGKGNGMKDGWETARRLDRPEIIHANDDGTLKVPGSEWAVYRLGLAGSVKRILVDTNHFKGNFPDSVRIEGTVVDTQEWTPQHDHALHWTTLLPTSKLNAHSEHWYDSHSSQKITHVRIFMAPDGGISRVRLLGTPLIQ